MPRPPNLKVREQILDAALALFHERGFQGVSMDDVATKAGVKKANLFHYYPTKDALGLAVLDRAICCCRESIVRQFQKEGDPGKIVEAMFLDSIRSMEKSRCCKGCFIGNLAVEVSDQNERLRRKVSEHLEFWAGQLADFLDRHRLDGYFKKELDSEQAAQAVISLLEGATLFAKASKKLDALSHARIMAITYIRTMRA